MKDHVKLLFSVFLVFLQFVSCSKKVKIDLPEPSYRLVMFSALNPSDSITASLGIVHSLDEEFQYSYDDTTVISQGYITLYENEQPVDTLFYDGRTKKFLSSYYPAVGKTYKLVAHLPGEDPAEGSTRIPSSPGASVVSARFTTDNNTTGSLLELTYHFPRSSGQPDYFLIRAYNINTQVVANKIPLRLYVPEMNEDYARVDYFLFKGEDLDATRNVTLFYQTWGVNFSVDSLSIEISRLSESAYKYMLTKNANSGADNFISTSDKENIYYNVKNGYGTVMSYHTQTINMNYPPN